MSIYGSFGGFDEDGEDERQPPLVYRGSHILPRMDGPRGGYLGLGHICGFISREGPGHDGDPTDNMTYWPYLRVSIQAPWHEDTVVLDVHQVDTLIEDLQSWRANVDMDRLDK